VKQSFVNISWKISRPCCVVIFHESFMAAAFSVGIIFHEIDFDLKIKFFVFL